MDAIRIEGGYPLRGKVTVGAAKNAVLPLLAAALLADGESRLRQVPKLADVRTLGRLLNHLGVQVRSDNGGMLLDAENVDGREAPYELVKTMRASVLVLGPLVARFGQARVSLPGGCAIGARPINLHLKGLEAMGADVVLEHGYVQVSTKRLRGASLVLDIPTVTGTENLMMAASLADGRTTIENAAREPEIIDLAECLVSMGARVRGAGSAIIEIEGVERLRPYDYTPIPDRIEAGTLMTAAALCNGDVTLANVRLDHLDAFVDKLRDAGASIDPVEGGDIRVVAGPRKGGVDIRTSPYPGFPTDMQAQFMALMATAPGHSVVTERVFENRFMHVSELNRMGADIAVEGASAVVRGVEKLSGAHVMATDLRASAALVLAGLAAEGTTVVSRVYHLDRGYESLEKKLAALGARIERFKE